MLALGAALAGGVLRARVRHRLPRPAAICRPRAAQRDRPLLARGHGSPAGALPAGGLVPGFVIDALAPVIEQLVGRAMPPQARHRRGSRSCRSPRAAAPTTACCVFVFIAVSALLAIEIIHRFASRAAAPRRRPGIAAFPTRARLTQYTGRQLRPADPARVRPVVFDARESVDMPAPGDARPARFDVTLRDLVWERSTLPIGRAVRLRGREAQPPAVPHHPPISEPGVRSPWSLLLLVLSIWT